MLLGKDILYLSPGNILLGHPDDPCNEKNRGVLIDMDLASYWPFLTKDTVNGDFRTVGYIH
jgi:hypothetical protein